MPADEFWNGDPYMAVIYRDVDLRRREDINANLWLQGVYFFEAVSIAICNSFRGKGQKALSYPEKPYRITPLTAKEKKAAKEAERQKAIKSLTAWKDAWDKANGGK